MPQLTVTSEDTASAMDEIVSKLGQDAVILSTKRIGSKYEISATTDQVGALGPRRRRHESQKPETFMDIFSAASSNNAKNQDGHAVQSNAAQSTNMVDTQDSDEPELAHTSTYQRAPNGPRLVDTTPYSETKRGVKTSHLKKHKPSVMDALLAPPSGGDAWQLSEQIQELSAQMQAFERQLKGLVITETSLIDQSMGPSLALQLRQSGFSDQVIRRFSHSFKGKSIDEGRVAFMAALSQAISINCMDTLATSKVIVVTGGRGSGKTSFCGKLATLLLESNPATPIALGEFSGANPNPNNELRNQARLMNLPINKIHMANLDMTIQSMRGRVIIDCDADACEVEALLDALDQSITADSVVTFMTMPGTSSARAIASQCALTNRNGALIALTKLDECEIAAQEASAFCELDTKIAFLTASRSFIDRLAIASEDAMAQYLNENC